MALMLLVLTSFFGMTYGEDATDGTTSVQPSRDRLYDLTDEITAAFEATPTTMPTGKTGTILDSIPIIDGGKTWYEIRWQDGTTGWSADIGLKNEISSGDEVETNSRLYVRDAAGGNALKAPDGTDVIMPAGAGGTIQSDDPIVKDGNTWWKVQYEDGTTGWSADVGLDNKDEISSGDEVTTTTGLGVRIAPNGVSVPSPSSINTHDRSGIISYGKHQFTLASGNDEPGSLYNVLVKYTTLSQTETATQMEAYLSRVKKKDETLRDETTFLELLNKAASEPEMVQAQDYVFAELYYDPAKQVAENDGMTSALAVVIYTDTKVQGGLETVSARTAKRFEGEKIGEDYTEQKWLVAFLDERKNYLLVDCVASHPKSAGYYRNAASNQGRVGILLNLVNSNNLDLKNGDKGDDFDRISLGDKGKVYAIDAPLRLEEAVDTQSFGDGPMAAALSLMLGYPMLSPSDSGISWLSDQREDVPETSGIYFEPAAPRPWFVDLKDYPDRTWWGSRSEYETPPVPLYFYPIGSSEEVRNKVGYKWIYLPYSQTGVWADQGYLDWVASIGIASPSGSYGTLT